jgi:hypothetical protein
MLFKLQSLYSVEWYVQTMGCVLFYYDILAFAWRDLEKSPWNMLW